VTKIIFSLLFIPTYFAVAQTSQSPFYLSEVLQISNDPLLQSTILVADKNTRQLYVFDPTKNILDPEKYEIDIGKNDGNKTKRDDKKTPEGIYSLETRKTQPEIPYDKYGSMAFTTNYPNVFDKFENKTGDGIWLHSVPDTVPLNRGSKGCVVLRNNNLKKVEQQIQLNKSFLIINNSITALSEQQYSEKKLRILDWVSKWKTTWQSQNLDQYIELYSDQFSAPPKYNKKSWLQHKKNLKQRYQFVKIELGSAHIFNQKNQYVLKFIQNYESDGHKDRGVKSLYVVDENGEFKILREEWNQI
jgi:murein L,D-transpeptidase YafK